MINEKLNIDFLDSYELLNKKYKNKKILFLSMPSSSDENLISFFYITYHDFYHSKTMKSPTMIYLPIFHFREYLHENYNDPDNQYIMDTLDHLIWLQKSIMVTVPEEIYAYFSLKATLENNPTKTKISLYNSEDIDNE